MTQRKAVQQNSFFLRISTPVNDFLKRFSIVLFIGLTLAGLVLSKSDAPVISSMRIAIIDSLLPIFKLASRPVQMVSNVTDTFHDVVALHSENNRLRFENIQLHQQLDETLKFQAENIQLHKLLNFVAEPHIRLITARVVGDISSPYIGAQVIGDVSGPYIRSAIIDAGKNSGIKKGQVVVNDHGLVGRIIEVGKRTSRILLITDFNSKIPVITRNSRERGIAAGNNTTTLNLIYLPEDSKVTPGEMVMTSGDGDLFPAGLPLGIVTDKTDKTFLIKPAVDWSKLEFVGVVND